jgi:hypothetical protein
VIDGKSGRLIAGCGNDNRVAADRHSAAECIIRRSIRSSQFLFGTKNASCRGSKNMALEKAKAAFSDIKGLPAEPIRKPHSPRTCLSKIQTPRFPRPDGPALRPSTAPSEKNAQPDWGAKR